MCLGIWERISKLHCRWQMVGVISHPLCSKMVVHGDIDVLFQTICLVCPKCEDWHPHWHRSPDLGQKYSLNSAVPITSMAKSASNQAPRHANYFYKHLWKNGLLSAALWIPVWFHDRTPPLQQIHCWNFLATKYSTVNCIITKWKRLGMAALRHEVVAT